MNKSASMSSLPNPSSKMISKQTEELVIQERLYQIEREHRSIGSIIDNRTLHNLDDVSRYAPGAFATNLKLKMKDENDRLNVRRNALTESDIKNETDEVISKMKSKGVNFSKFLGNFDDEELIWRTKSMDPLYDLKRKYYFPELQEFHDNMTPAQKKEFKSRSQELFCNLVIKLRQDISKMKIDMDYAGIFHPDANSHRAHCLYLKRLYKLIESSNIEDPVLRDLLEEKMEEERKAAFEEEQKANLIRIAELSAMMNAQQDVFESRNKAALITSNVVDNKPVYDSSKYKISEQAALFALKPRKPLAEPKFKVEKVIVPSKPPPMPKKLLIETRMNDEKINKKELKTPDRKKFIGINQDDHQAKSSPKSVSSDTNPSEIEVSSLNPQLTEKNSTFFQKIKRNKLGNADPKDILLEEAEKLDKSESSHSKKTRDSSHLFDEEMMNWIVSNLQKNQIDRTSGGKQVVSSDESSSSSVPSSTANASKLKPQIANFDEFQQMFMKYSDMASSKEPPTLQHSSSVGSLKDKRSPTHSKDQALFASPMINNNNNNNSSLDISQATPFQSHFHSTIDNSFVDDKNRDSKDFQPMDLVGHLASEDPMFDSFMKMSLREKPAGKRLFKGVSKLGKPRKIRQIPPLGRKAVLLQSLKDNGGLDMNSDRLLESKDAKKGFRNVFREYNINDDDDADDGDVEDPEDTVAEDEEDDGSLLDPSLGSASPPESPGGTSTASKKLGLSFPAAVSTIVKLRGFRARHSKHRKTKVRVATAQDTTSSSAQQPVIDYDIQSRLLEVWDILQVPSVTRLNFLKKYSTEEFAACLNSAVLHWSVLAVLVIARLQLLRLIKKFQLNYCVFPIDTRSLLDSFSQRLPPSFTTPPIHHENGGSNSQSQTTSSSLASASFNHPGDHASEHNHEEVDQEMLEIYEAIQREIDGIVFDINSQFEVYPDGNVENEDQMKELLENLLRSFNDRLLLSSKRTMDDIDDLVPFGSIPIRDWVGQKIEITILNESNGN